MAKYTYTIFDSNPSLGSTPWPEHQDVEIEADTDFEASEQVEQTMSAQAAGLRAADGYGVGQLLYAYVWDDSDTIVGTPTYSITAQDLGLDGKEHVEDWDTEASYVCTFPGDNREGACDVEVQVGEGLDGQWYVRTTDDGGGSDECNDKAFDSESEARAAANEFASKNNEANPGEDADDYLARMLEEKAGEPNPEGEFCVYWETSLDDAGPRERYETQAKAEAAAEIANNELHQHNPGGNLLCGFEVRQLDEGEWVRLRD